MFADVPVETVKMGRSIRLSRISKSEPAAAHEQRTLCRAFLLAALLLINEPGAAQEQGLEKFFESAQESEDGDVLTEYLEWRREHPLDLNRATAAELQSLPWLGPEKTRAIISRRRQKPFQRISELGQLAGFNRELIGLLQSYLCIRPITPSQPVCVQGRLRLIRKKEESDGFRQNAFLGDPWKICSQGHFDWRNRLQLGWLTEKDAGEKRWDDLIRFYSSISIPAISSEFLAGHFTVESGSGLVFPSASRLNPADDFSVRRHLQTTLLRPCLSTDENSGYVGAAWQFHSSQASLLMFTSRRRWDARIIDDTLRSLQPSGLHRTAAESRFRDRLQSDMQGFAVSSSLAGMGILTVTLRRCHFSYPFLAADEISERFDFTGRADWLAGAQSSLNWRTLHAAGECAADRRGASAATGHLLWQHRDLEAVVTASRCAPGFSDPMMELCGSEWKNQQAFSLGAQYDGDRGRVSIYHARTKNLWPGYRLPMPGQRECETVITASWPLTEETELSLRYRRQIKPVAQEMQDEWDRERQVLISDASDQLRLQLEITRPMISMRTRLEGHWYSPSAGSPEWHTGVDSSGWLLYQQIRCVGRSGDWLARAALFDGLCYQTRFYCYENDLPGLCRIKMLYGRGVRWFLRWSFHPCRQMTFSLKWEQTWYDHAKEMGSGLDHTAGRQESQISIQLDWRWRGR